ncbi:hypothetical protein [Candidatus Sororendozoicomonas aggregata]|uniref:hypothetical protein n=1 Tax=Candidatus Sororendozoicomonas aggregata TaxID=3073239 RepID=UPI002ED11A05
MNVLTKLLVGVSIALLATMSFAADVGNEVSTYKIDGGNLGSGSGSGKGDWGIKKTEGKYQSNNETLAAGKGQTDITIYDTNTQKTTLTNTRSVILVSLHNDAATNNWRGTLSVLSCKNLGGKTINGCNLVKLIKPIDLYDIKVNLDSDNSGTVSFKNDLHVLGVKAVATASYKLSKSGFKRD